VLENIRPITLRGALEERLEDLRPPSRLTSEPTTIMVTPHHSDH
jgi:hypothetical protein